MMSISTRVAALIMLKAKFPEREVAQRLGIGYQSLHDCLEINYILVHSDAAFLSLKKQLLSALGACRACSLFVMVR